MARLIVKCKYLKAKLKNIGEYARYIATREGVEKIDDSKKYNPATQKQEQLIEKILKDFPDTKEMLEYEDYRKSPTVGTASEFISRALEDNLAVIAELKTYADYIATRPRAEYISGTHGLFTDDGIAIELSKVSDELNSYDGNVYIIIASLRRKDAQSLGFDTGARWRDMLRAQAAMLAENLKIPINNFKWYAAFHNEKHHPHVHIIAYSSDSKDGYLTKKGIEKIKSSFVNDIFQQELLEIYQTQTQRRDELRSESREQIKTIVDSINQDGYENPKLEGMLMTLADKLSRTKGKKVYAYLPPQVKAMVDEIVDEMAKDERIEKLYDLWYTEKEKSLQMYRQELPKRIPLSKSKDFLPIRNAIVQEAMNIILDRLEIDDDDTEFFDKEKFIRFRSLEELEAAAEKGHDYAEYMLGKLLYKGGEFKGEEISQDIGKALKYLERAAAKDNPYAAYTAGKIYLTEGSFRDIARAVRFFEAAAEDGNGYAEYQLGKLYLFGKYTDRNRERAVAYLTAAADKGIEAAKYLLSLAEQGIGYTHYSISLGVAGLFTQLAKMFRDPRLNNEQQQDGGGVDSKEMSKVMEKKQALGQKQ